MFALTTTLLSANLAGLPGTGDSFPDAISTNGQFILFESNAGDLVSGDNNGQSDVFLRDLINQQTVLISGNTNGVPGNGLSHNAVMTPDARFIAFSSAASDLVVLDTNSIPDVFVRDRLAGTTTTVSVGAISTGSVTLPSTSESPDITPDGRYVSFYTSATNLLPGVTNAGQVFVRDTLMGATLWASTNAATLFQSVFGTNHEISCNQRLSTNGQYVIFEACTNLPTFTASNYAMGLVLRYNTLTGGTDLVATNATVPALQFEDINTLDITPDGRFVAYVAATNVGSMAASFINLWDGQSATATLVSQNLMGGNSGSDVALWPRLDATGRYVAFIASAANLVSNTVSGYNCYLRDTQAGTTTLLNVDTNYLGTGVSILTPPSVCSDGHLIAYVAGDGNLVANHYNNALDIFVRDANAGTTELESVHDPAQADSSTGFSSGFSPASVSSNGLFVAFTSQGSLVTADTNNLRDVYLRDMANTTNILVSVNTNGVAASGISSEPSTDASGRYVVFSSSATDLVAGDSNNSFDVFLRDTVAGTTTLVSKDITGTGEGDADSYTPVISSDARYVLYFSLANNLTSGSFSGVNLFLGDLQNGTNYALTSGGANSASITPDGHRVAFTTSGLRALYVWDTRAAQKVYKKSASSILSGPSISPDGNLVAWFDTQIEVANLASNTVTAISPGTAPRRFGGNFSSDDRFFVYSVDDTNALDTNSVADIYLFDFQSGSNTLISQSYDSATSPNGSSDSPVISPDGRYIAFRSLAGNAVSADGNEVPDLVLYDRSNAVTTLITASSAGNRTADNRSEAASFSADGKNLVFTSWANDLLPHDFNPGSDVFLFPLPGSAVSVNTNSGTAGNTVAGVRMFQAPSPSTVPAFSWPAQAGASYVVQYTDDLTDPVWQNLAGSAVVLGNLGEAYDLNPSASNRFYRVVIGN